MFIFLSFLVSSFEEAIKPRLNQFKAQRVDSVKIVATIEGLILEVSVKPRSREFEIITEEDEIMVFCTEEPTEGRVNRELIKELSKLFHKRIELVSGFASKQKKLLIRDAEKAEIEHILLDK